jgi:hypothetical protein
MDHAANITAALRGLDARADARRPELTLFSLRSPLSRRAEHVRARETLLHALSAAYPLSLLWSKHAQAEFPSLGPPFATESGVTLWRASALGARATWPEILAEGAWGLFYFDAEPLNGIVPPALETDVNGAWSVLQAMNARASIVSWFDDNEWIVAVPPDAIDPCRGNQ